MTDPSDKTAAIVAAAKRALAMKQAATEKGGGANFQTGRQAERAAAARSASKSKPALRK